MHLLRTQPVISALVAGAIAPQERAAYLMASFLMFTVAYYSGLVGPGAPTWSIPSVLEALIVAGITILGIVKAFDASGGPDNPDFVAEFTCLYVPITITTLLGVWSVYWLVMLSFRESLEILSQRSSLQFAMNLWRIGTDLAGFLSFAAVVLVQVITFIRITSALHRVRLGRARQKVVAGSPESA
jgi:hypothetical protein